MIIMATLKFFSKISPVISKLHLSVLNNIFSAIKCWKGDSFNTHSRLLFRNELLAETVVNLTDLLKILNLFLFFIMYRNIGSC